MKKVKNILFIMADQLRWDYLSCYGHPHLKTPNIDGLVFLKDSKGLSPGDFAEVKIIDSSEHDLWAERS